MTDQHRHDFRQAVFAETDNICIVPWCDEHADDAHHLIERELWTDGGYIPENGASVCNKHHRAAETNDIPPQAFWFWKGIQQPPLPDSIDTQHVDKWGSEFDVPPWKEYRERIKYQSSRHLLPLYWYDENATQEDRLNDDDTGLTSVDEFLDVPLVITEKMDGSNAMLIRDTEYPVRARNGKTAEHKSFAPLKDLYWEYIHENLPGNLQVFGEWTYAKHSIHYGCDCDQECEDVAPALLDLLGDDAPDDNRAYFQVFGVYHTEYDLWLSWDETEMVAKELGLPTVPVLRKTGDADESMFENPHVFTQEVYDLARKVVLRGGEGVVVRNKYPFHYGQFSTRLGKYVRPNHVKTDEHWSSNAVTPNNLS